MSEAIVPGGVGAGGAVGIGKTAAEATAAKAAAANAAKNGSIGKGTSTSSGGENIATYPKLKDELLQQNLNNIAKQDPRLAEAVKGSGTTNPNFSVGAGSVSEADRLGKIWVGDGGKLVDNQAKCPGCWISADSTRLYRPPTAKKSQFATTGVQANFQQFDKSGAMISNGHLNVTK
ncbi:Uncharacterised protein [Serratia liquefaciens]|uniref:hypothetical protein n=1 Tax=Serratia liquefaciens TaxID=614 RepID=UPI00217BB184|nr:hypothetical protein [Serratia liquefaciens]CAI1910534.1 Uncharacterised protein [Serratia liquefaciens]